MIVERNKHFPRQNSHELNDFLSERRESKFEILNQNHKIFGKRTSKVFKIEDQIIIFAKDSLFFLSNDNKFRKMMQSLLCSKKYTIFINTIILLNCFFLIFETIDNMDMLNFVTNIIFTSVFTIEMVIKIIAYGFILEEYSYLRDGWNWLDFIIVIIGLASLTSELNTNLLPLRAFRLIRPLKTITLLPHMKYFLSTLLNSLLDLSSVFLMILFFFLIFAILGLSLWNDRYDYLCRKTDFPVNGLFEVDSLFSNSLCGGEVTCNNNLARCLSAKEFKDKDQYFFNPRYNLDDDVYKLDLNYGITNFNNIFNSLYVVFQTTTTKGWTDIMYIYMNGYNYFVSLIYFCLCVIFNYFFLLNLTVAMLLYNFERNRFIEERKIEAEEQRSLKDNTPNNNPVRTKRRKSSNKFDTLMKVVLNEVSSKKKYRREYTPINEVESIRAKELSNLRTIIHKFSKTRYFEHVKRTSDYHIKFYFCYLCYYIYKQPIVQYFFYSCIIANSIILLLNRLNQNDSEFQTIETINYFFVSIFTFEILILFIGIGFRKFVRDYMNIWDFLIVLISLIEIIVLRNFLSMKSSSSSIASIFRMLRILRIFKLIRTWQSFQVTMASIKETLTRMWDYIFIFAIFIYIFALLGCIFFRYSLRFDPTTNKYSENEFSTTSNFDDFLSSLVSVFQILIGDNWFKLYYDCYRSEINSVGQTIFYFVTLVLFGHITMLNIFLAYLIDNFENARKHLHKNIKVKKHIENIIYYCSQQHELDMVDYNSKTKNQSTIVSVFNYYLQKLENKKLLSEGRFIIAAKFELDFLMFKRKKIESYDKFNKKNKENKYLNIIFFDEWFMVDKKKNFDPDSIDFFEFGFEQERKMEDNYEFIKNLDLHSDATNLEKTKEDIKKNSENERKIEKSENDHNLDESQSGNRKLKKKLSIVNENPHEEMLKTPYSIRINKINTNSELDKKLDYHSDFMLNILEENSPHSFENSFKSYNNEDIPNTDDSNEIKPVTKDPDNGFISNTYNKQKTELIKDNPGLIFNLDKFEYIRNSLTQAENKGKVMNTITRNYEEKPRNSKSYANNYIYNYRGIRNFLSNNEVSEAKRENKIKITSENTGINFKIRNHKTYRDTNNFDVEEFIKNSLNHDDEEILSDSINYFEFEGEKVLLEKEQSSNKSLLERQAEMDGNQEDNKDIYNKSAQKEEKKFSSNNTLKFFQKTKTMESMLPFTFNKTKKIAETFKENLEAKKKARENNQERRLPLMKRIWKNLANHISRSSLCFFHKDWKLRKFITKLVEHKIFKYFITIIILANCVTICLDNPWLNPKETYFKTINLLNKIFSIIFILEAGFKIISYGFLFKSNSGLDLRSKQRTSSFIKNAENILLENKLGSKIIDVNQFTEEEKINLIKKSIKTIEKKTAYLRDISNLIDFFVVIISLFDLIGFQSIRYLNTMRALRSLRPIRIITKNRNLKLITTCLLKSIPAMANVLLVCGVFILIYAILGVSLFKVDLNYYCTMPQFNNQDDCIRNGDLWVYNYENFSNILIALKTLFELMMSQGWVTIMITASQNLNNKWVYLYFITFVILGYLFILNLLVSIVVHKFKILKNKENHFSQLTEEEREWVKVQKVMMKYRPTPRTKIDDKSKFMKSLYNLILSKKFENIVLITILLSLLSLIMQYNGQFEAYNLTLDSLNYFFTLLFTLELILKIIVYRKIFFQNAWNIFDFVVISLCFIMMIINVLSYIYPILTIQNISALPVILRSLRFLRAIRLLTAYSKLRALIDTLVYLLPTIINIGMVLIILIIIYGCIGMNLFGTMPFRENIHPNNNFKNFLSSALLLFRITTGEKWNYIMNELSYHNCSYSNPEASTDYYCLKYNNTCYADDDLNYETLMSGGYSCGTSFSYFYFISFMIIGPVFIMNLCVVMVIEGFSESMYENSGLLSQEYMDHFVSVWMNYDPECKKVVRPHEFVLILKEMYPPFGLNYDRYLISDPSKIWAQRQKLILFRKFLQDMQSKNYNRGSNEFDCDYTSPKFRRLSHAYEFKNFYMSKNKKFTTTDLEVLKLMNKFKFAAVEQKGIFKKNYSYTFTNLTKKDANPLTIIEYDKGLYIHFVDACLGLSRFVVSKNSNIGFEKFRENIVGNFTKKMWGGVYNQKDIALLFNEDKKNKVSEKLGIRMISKVKMLFVKKLHKIREKLAAKKAALEMRPGNEEEREENHEEDREVKENYSGELNFKFLPHQYYSKIFEDNHNKEEEEEDLYQENLKEKFEEPIHLRTHSHSHISIASSHPGRNRGKSVSTQNKSHRDINYNNLFYDLEEIQELNEVESDSQLDDIKIEIDAYLDMNKNFLR